MTLLLKFHETEQGWQVVPWRGDRLLFHATGLLCGPIIIPEYVNTWWFQLISQAVHVSRARTKNSNWWVDALWRFVNCIQQIWSDDWNFERWNNCWFQNFFFLRKKNDWMNYRRKRGINLHPYHEVFNIFVVDVSVDRLELVEIILPIMLHLYCISASDSPDHLSASLEWIHYKLPPFCFSAIKKNLICPLKCEFLVEMWISPPTCDWSKH